MSSSSPTKFSHITDLSRITSIDTVMTELNIHEQAFIGTDIERLIYFSRTYSIMNRNINLACANGYFLNPELINRLQIHFALLYFETLNNYTATGRIPRQWSKATNHKSIGIMPAGLSLFHAIKAHIDCDASKALHSLDVKPALLAKDFFSINAMILDSSREVVDSYNPNSWLSHVRKIARKGLIVPICLVIFSWRKNAWRSFLSMHIVESGNICDAHSSVRAINTNCVQLVFGSATGKS